jgi:hypothetical protein
MKLALISWDRRFRGAVVRRERRRAPTRQFDAIPPFGERQAIVKPCTDWLQVSEAKAPHRKDVSHIQQRRRSLQGRLGCPPRMRKRVRHRSRRSGVLKIRHWSRPDRTLLLHFGLVRPQSGRGGAERPRCQGRDEEAAHFFQVGNVRLKTFLRLLFIFVGSSQPSDSLRLLNDPIIVRRRRKPRQEELSAKIMNRSWGRPS